MSHNTKRLEARQLVAMVAALGLKVGVEGSVGDSSVSYTNIKKTETTETTETTDTADTADTTAKKND